ncbi:MAG: redoxin domain-containing protein [Rhodospirillales bacterium]|nr:redoxin domain-containing protein [Rhodospirillales bacterium]
MSKLMRFAAAAAFSLVSLTGLDAAPAVNQPAPGFTATTAKGETLSLEDLAGKTVILEWTNHLCPFVGKHYGSGNMQALQQEMTEKDIVWLQVISSAPGKQGYVEGPEAIVLNKGRSARPSGTLLDPAGTLGRAYAALVTPQMYIIDPQGSLLYTGGIDSIPSANPADIPSATNYVREAMTAIEAGKPVPNPVTRAYGCTVKYAPSS